jgi:hypothetical protein
MTPPRHSPNPLARDDGSGRIALLGLVLVVALIVVLTLSFGSGL